MIARLRRWWQSRGASSALRPGSIDLLFDPPAHDCLQAISALSIVDAIARERLEEKDRQLAKMRMGYAAALSDLRDAKSETAHVRSIAREFEDRALKAEAQLERVRAAHAQAALDTWARFGAQGGGDRHRKRKS